MIICIRTPDGELVYIPLRDRRDCWVAPPGVPPGLRTWREALVLSWRHAARAVDDVRHLADVMRGLCDHPNFDFCEDGIDSQTVQRIAREMAVMAARAHREVDHLIAEPQDDACVRIDETLYRRADDGTWRPSPTADGSNGDPNARPDEPEESIKPDS